MSSFNQRLKELRLSRELSQQTLADKIGISKSSINMYERGEREPSLETLEAFADFFNVDMNYLLGVGRPAITTISKAGGLRHPLDEDLTADVSVTSYIDPDDPKPQKEKPAEDDGLSPNRRKLIDWAKTVPEDKVEQVYSVIQSILEALK